MSGVFHSGDKIAGKYSVQFFIKMGSHAETYRVKDSHGTTLFLKLFHLARLHRTQFDGEGNIKEIEFLKTVSHPNIVTYRDHGEFVSHGQRFAFLVLEYISGETVEDRLKRDQLFDGYRVRMIVEEVLEGLHYLHVREKPLIHNDINLQNVMLDLSGAHVQAKIIDFGYARSFHNSTKVYYRDGLNPFYLAPECFQNMFSPQTDLFAVGALIIHLLTGLPPWHIDFSDYKRSTSTIDELIEEARRKPLRLPAAGGDSVPDPFRDHLISVAVKALQPAQKRFNTALEMLQVVRGQEAIITEQVGHSSSGEATTHKRNRIEAGKGGFEDIAGMDELKEVLFHDVIRALQDKDLYQEYGLTIPNGMLLYGPPGCGKSFFAQKLAEEAGYTYIEVKPSELASIYVHGAQEKIGKLFDEARKQAPIILNFEEFDALVPNRNSHAGKNQGGEVNEFLAQLNNCGKDGIFVIASSNQPDLIDSAVLRRGRIDKIYYVPPPDHKARLELFKLFLQKRPVDLGLDYDILARETKDYMAVDLEHIVNEAARQALRTRSNITHELLLKTIAGIRPSVRKSEIERYERMKASIEQEDQAQGINVIGFGKRT